MRVGDPILEAEKRVGETATRTGRAAIAETRARWGDRIRRQREAAGISQKELAREAGVSHGWLSELETGTAATLDLLSPVNQALRKRLFGKIRECLDVLEW